MTSAKRPTPAQMLAAAGVLPTDSLADISDALLAGRFDHYEAMGRRPTAEQECAAEEWAQATALKVAR